MKARKYDSKVLSVKICKNKLLKAMGFNSNLTMKAMAQNKTIYSLRINTWNSFSKIDETSKNSSNFTTKSFWSCRTNLKSFLKSSQFTSNKQQLYLVLRTFPHDLSHSKSNSKMNLISLWTLWKNTGNRLQISKRRSESSNT